MSALGGSGSDYRVRGDLVLDLDQFVRELGRAGQRMSQESRSWSARLREGLRAAADAAIALGISVEGIRRAWDTLGQAVERMAAQHGDLDPAVQRWEELRAAMRATTDQLARTILESATFAGATAGVTAALRAVARAVEVTTDALDRWVLRHPRAVQAALIPVVILVESLRHGMELLSGAARVVVGTFRAAAGAIGVLLAPVLLGVSLLAEAIAGRGGLATDVRRFLVEFTRESIHEVGRGIEQVGTGVDQLGAATSRVLGAATRDLERVADILARLREQSVSTAERTARRVLDHVVRFGSAVQTSLSGTFGAIAAEAQQLADQLREIGDTAGRGMALAASDLASAMGALFLQLEQSGGRSQRAAEIMARAQLAAIAAVSAAKGLMEVGEAFSAAGDGNALAAAAHGLAAGAFFAAAALAGARAAGAFGSVVPRVGGKRAQREAERLGQLQAPPPNVIVVIEGNVLDNEEFVRRSLAPTLARLLERNAVQL